MNGGDVCRMHGGSAPQARARAKLRFAELVDPAIAILAREMVQAEKSGEKQSAANSILDRAGYGRSQTIESEDIREVILERIRSFRELEITDESGEE